MKAIIVCTSVSHGNTRKVADAMGQILDARVVTPEQVGPAELSDYDLVGFGSGIYLGSFHSQLHKFVQALPQGRQSKAFVFATSGFSDAGIHSYSRPLVRLLDQKGFEVVDTFSCRALDTFSRSSWSAASGKVDRTTPIWSRRAHVYPRAAGSDPYRVVTGPEGSDPRPHITAPRRSRRYDSSSRGSGTVMPRATR